MVDDIVTRRVVARRLPRGARAAPARARLGRRRRAVPRVEAPPEPVRRVADVGRARRRTRRRVPRVPPLGARRAERSRALRGTRGGHRHRSRLPGPRHLHPPHARGARRAARRRCGARVQHAERTSLPGYLKMGWQEVGRLPAAVRPTRWRFVRGRRARAGARRPVGSCRASWACRRATGSPITARSTACSRRRRAPLGLATRRSGRYLHWRYGNPDLGYRLLVHGPPAEPEGLLVFRLRRRGAAVEGVVDDLVAPARLAPGGPGAGRPAGPGPRRRLPDPSPGAARDTGPVSFVFPRWARCSCVGPSPTSLCPTSEGGRRAWATSSCSDARRGRG